MPIPQPIWALLPARRVLRVGAVATFPPAISDRIGFRHGHLDRVETAIHQRISRLIPKSLTETAGQRIFNSMVRFSRPAWRGALSADNLAARHAQLETGDRI